MSAFFSRLPNLVVKSQVREVLMYLVCVIVSPPPLVAANGHWHVYFFLLLFFISLLADHRCVYLEMLKCLRS